MENKSWLTILPQLLIAMLITALLPIFGLWYVNYEGTRQGLQSAAENNLEQVADLMALKVNDWVELNQKALNQNVRLPAMRTLEADQQLPILKAIDETYGFTGVFTTDANADAIVRSDGRRLANYTDRDYYKQIFERDQEFGQQVVIGRAVAGRPILVMAAPIRNGDGDRVGMLAAVADLVNISRNVVDIGIGTTGFGFLVDGENRVIAHGDSNRVSERLQDFSDHPALQGRTANEIFTFDDNGQQAIALVRELDLGWRLVVQQNYDEVFAPLQIFQRNALIVLAVAIVVTLLVVFLVANFLSGPIRRLTRVVDAYSRGEIDAKIPHMERGDEIGELARAVDRMGTSLKMALAELN